MRLLDPFARPGADGSLRYVSTSPASCARRMSRPGSRIVSRPGHTSLMIGVPHAPASNSRTLGEYPASTMSRRVTFNVKRRRL